MLYLNYSFFKYLLIVKRFGSLRERRCKRVYYYYYYFYYYYYYYYVRKSWLRNLSSTDKESRIQCPESGIHRLEPRIQDFTWGDTCHVPQFVHLYIFLTRQCILCCIRRYSYNYFILFSRDGRYSNLRKIRFGRCNCLSAIDFGIDRTK